MGPKKKIFLRLIFQRGIGYAMYRPTTKNEWFLCGVLLTQAVLTTALEMYVPYVTLTAGPPTLEP